MEINSQVNTFEGGMNMDSDISMLRNNQYRWAENIRLLTDNAGTTGVLQNIEDVRQYENGLGASEIILGTAVTRWYNKAKGIVEECGIVITKELYEGDYINNIYAVTNFDSIKPTWNLVVSAEMDLIKKVAIVSNYETESVSKIYISDGVSAIKCVNISKEYDTTKSNHITDNTYFDLLPSSTIAPFILESITTGSLPAGMVQYCYQLFTTHGSETATSSLSAMIPIISDNSNRSKTVNGDPKDTMTDKGCLLKATMFNDGRFERVRIISIQYLTNNQVPRIYVVNECDLPESESGTVTFTYNDNGTGYISELSIEEFNDLVPFEFNAKSIAKMNNRLFASNIQELTWDVDYDARAYRCNSKGIVKLNSSISDNIELPLKQILDPLNDVIIPKQHDCINPMNSQTVYPNDVDSEYAYGFDVETNTAEEPEQSEEQPIVAKIRGGKGFNISYRFIIADLIESDGSTVSDGESNKPFIGYNLELSSMHRTTNSIQLRCPETNSIVAVSNISTPGSRIRNYCDPFYVANFLGYQRDEVYRFGIVFYNNKNIPSPVHWIGDIRFPSADIPGYEPFTFGGTVDGSGNYELVSHPLGIQFQVSNIPTDVTAYEIVRCDRTISDRTVVAQGLLNRTIRYNGWANSDDYVYSRHTLGPMDRRPAIMPTFSASKNTAFAQGYYVIQDNRMEQQKKQLQNPFDTNGVFDLVSPEICFNKEKSEQIITSDAKIVPLYCGMCATYCNDAGNEHHRCGIPFTGVINITSTEYQKNPFGGIASEASHVSDKPALENGVLDGFEQNGTGESGGICKYYQFFTKEYANYQNSNNRIAFDINSAIKTTNISPYTDLEGAKGYIDYIDKYSYVNWSIGSYEAWGPHGVNMVVTSNNLYDTYNGISRTPYGSKYSYNAVLFVNIKKRAAQYGGDTYANRQNSVYISTNTYVKPTWDDYNNPICFGGDTYLGVFDYSHTLLFTKNVSTDMNGYKRYVGCYIPLESSVNLYYRNDTHFSQETLPSRTGATVGSANIYYTTEPGTLNTISAQSVPMYAYNAAYSSSSTSKSYIQKSMYAEDDVKSSNRITCSELKTNNEQTDSWTKFKFANYLDVDSSYGPITNLKVFKNRLYYFQDSAVGIASVNDRSLITDNNAGALVLGTGGILTRFDYLVTLNGDSIVNDKSITNSETTIYWYDLDKNVLCSLGNGFNELSKVKFVQTYLNRLPDKARTNPVSFYDKKYNEVWFRVYDRSLIFNEQLGVFTSFYTHNPNWFFPFSTRLVTIKNNNCYYLHNMYDVNSEVKEERVSYIRFVVNKDMAQTKVFDNQWMYADLTDPTNQDQTKILKNIYFTTKTQETEPINWENIDHREDNYRFPIGREKQNDPYQQEQTNMSYAGRMRGKYLICNYTFDCNNNKEFKLPYVKTTYRYSML